MLLTGADGYIGRSMQQALLARDYEVHAISRNPKPSTDTITWHQVDLFDPAAVDNLLANYGGSHLIHLAWVTEPGAYWQSADNARWRDTSIALLRRFSAHGGQRVVLAGTCAEYDWSNGHCVEGSTPLVARSPYTEAKLAFREAALEFSDTSGMDLAWARVFFSFGPDEHPARLVPSVVNALLHGERARCSDGRQVRDFMYVRDLAAAFAAVLDSTFCGDINIASGEAVSIKDLVTRIAVKMGADQRLDFGARPRQAGEPDRITADISKLTKIVGFESKTKLETAIDETIAWWQRQVSNLIPDGA
ncbi:MAG TPA: NAD(P)-dependent oxidoreductase [Woeseiaceae bacterium]|nr:NAD(P)-dependent oxidoreductase [Woeseiaceae bacterium]